MKVLIVGDVHFTSKPVISTWHGRGYTDRLDDCVDSLRWVEQGLTKTYNPDKIVYAGDFFDKATITAEEAERLKDVPWDFTREHVFLVGNHELGTKGCSVSVLGMLPNFRIIDKTMDTLFGDANMVFLPYIKNCDLTEELKGHNPYGCPTIIISHNDIQGHYGSKNGLKEKDIIENCHLFINGHVHRAEILAEGIVNIGTLTAVGLGEEGGVHHVILLDTYDMSMQFINNPYAKTVVKAELKSKKQISELCKTGNYVSIESVGAGLLPTFEREASKTFTQYHIHRKGIELRKIGLENVLTAGDYTEIMNDNILRCWDEIKQYVLYGKKWSGRGTPLGTRTIVKVVFWLNGDEYVIFRTENGNIYEKGLSFFRNDEDISGETDTETQNIIRRVVDEMDDPWDKGGE